MSSIKSTEQVNDTLELFLLLLQSTSYKLAVTSNALVDKNLFMMSEARWYIYIYISIKASEMISD